MMSPPKSDIGYERDASMASRVTTLLPPTPIPQLPAPTPPPVEHALKKRRAIIERKVWDIFK